MSIKNLPLDEIHRLFYIKDNELYWKINVGRKIKADTIAGSIEGKKYRRVNYDGQMYRAHRIMYMIYNNIEIPDDLQIDHIDRNRLNNSKENLRISTKTQNQWNRSASHITHWIRRKILKSGQLSEISYWKLLIRTDGKRVVKLFPYTIEGLEAAKTLRAQILLESRKEFACC